MNKQITPKHRFTLGHFSEVWNPKFGRYSHELMKIARVHECKFCLEIGVGDGRYTTRLVKYGNTVVGVDVSGEMLARCFQNLKNEGLERKVIFIQADAEHLPFRDNIFEKIICIATLVHVPHYYKTITECFRVLKSNGEIITENINFFQPSILFAWMQHRISKILLRRSFLEITPYYPRTPKTLLHAFHLNKAQIDGVFGFFLVLPFFINRFIRPDVNPLSFKMKSSRLKLFGSGLVIRAHKT